MNDISHSLPLVEGLVGARNSAGLCPRDAGSSDGKRLQRGQGGIPRKGRPVYGLLMPFTSSLCFQFLFIQLTYDPCWNAENKRPGRHVLCHNRIGSYDCILADFDPWENAGPLPNS